MSEVHLLLTFSPLAFYFFLLGVWQSGRDPRLIPGPLDFGLLGFGIGGFLAFGPIGQFLAGLLLDSSGWPVRLVLLTILAGLAFFLSTRAHRRLVIYGVDPLTLDRALRQVLGELPGNFERTLRGFEDRPQGRGVIVEVTPWLRAAEVIAYGRDPETLISALGLALRPRLRGPTSGRSTVARGWFALSALTLAGPVARLLLNGLTRRL